MVGPGDDGLHAGDGRCGGFPISGFIFGAVAVGRNVAVGLVGLSVGLLIKQIKLAVEIY